ncbi:ecdysone-induced protein 78C [Lepeophtheirus salmonis]|nr:ecdysone-induced protein 78C-like [Lepeophtheirus salmonis]
MDPISDSSVSSSTWSFSDRLHGHRYEGNAYGRRRDSSSTNGSGGGIGSGGGGGGIGSRSGSGVGGSKMNSSSNSSSKGNDNDNVVSSTTSSPPRSSSSFYLSNDSTILRNALLDKNRKSYSLRKRRRKEKTIASPVPASSPYPMSNNNVVDSVKLALEINCPYTTQILISQNHYQRVLQRGMDPTEEREVLWLRLIEAISPTIAKVVEFSKQIPGFLDLPQDDQLLLIKYGFFETWLLWTSLLRRVSPGDEFPGIYLTKLLHFILKKPSLVEGILSFWSSIHQLNLKASQMALFSALLLLVPTRRALSQSASIHRLRNKILSILEDLIREDSVELNGSALSEARNERPVLLTKILRLESQLRTLEKEHRESLDWLRSRRRSGRLTREVPVLWSEIFDIPPCGIDLSGAKVSSSISNEESSRSS